MTIDSNWTCPGPCWSNPMKTQMSTYAHYLWESGCEVCDSLGCPYGEFAVEGGGCLICQWDPSLHFVMRGTNIISSCDDPGVYTCEKGYYNSSGGGDVVCKACSTMGLPNCPKGTFLKRCVMQSEVDNSNNNNNVFCNTCDNPPLPDAVMYRYGFGRVYDDCESTYGTSKFSGPASCAWFLTPKWHRGICDIECNDGYLPTNAGNPPTCLKCNTSCPAGWRPPLCTGGKTVLSEKTGDCEKCVNLPLHAHWTNFCEWECDFGYYSDGFLCWPCSSSSAAAVCDSPSYYFMGCSGTQSGHCVFCDVNACAAINNDNNLLHHNNNYYLKTDIWMDKCACVSCSAATLGISYYARNCSANENSEVRLCRKTTCPEGFYAERACTLWSDVICTACSQPPYEGLLLISKCTNVSNAVYMPCFDGMACNGTSTAFQCSNDKVAVKGVCKCKPATYYSSSRAMCIPLNCPPGMYPNPLTDACANCTASMASSSLQPLLLLPSKPGVVGLDACVCPEGFFAQNVDSGNNYNHSTFIKCWPCGDLGCLRGLQRQSVCDGLNRKEPTCNCAPAPGTLSSIIISGDYDKCASLRCMDGYFPSSTYGGVLSGLHDHFLFLEKDSRPHQTLFLAQQQYFNNNNNNNNNNNGNSSSSSSSNSENVKDAVIIDHNISLVLSTEGKLYIMRLDNGKISKVNLDILIVGIRSELIGVTAILSHEGTGSSGYAWVAFTYWGLCEEVGDVYINCSAIELVSFQPLTSLLYLSSASYCMVGVEICALLATQSWGKIFPFSGTSSKIHALTFDAPRVNFYMALTKSHSGSDFFVIAKYNLKFYQASKRIEERDDDYPLEILGVSPLPIVSISAGLEAPQNIFALCNSYYDGSGILLLLLQFSLKSQIWSAATTTTTPTSSTVLIFNTNLSEVVNNNKNNNNNNKMKEGQIFRLSDRLLLIKSPGKEVKFLDMWNNILSPLDYDNNNNNQNNYYYNYYDDKGNFNNEVWAFRENVLFRFNKSQLDVYRWVYPCPTDTLVYEDFKSDGCVPMQCLLSEPCGPHSVRKYGESVCQCLQGYYSSSSNSYNNNNNNNNNNMCLGCPASYYCPGNGLAIACPPNSISSALAESIMDCLCKPGFYHFGDHCILCPTNTWCPIYGTMTPVPCYASGTTSTVGGSLSPLDCVCPDRTHGLLCEPCGDDEECVLIGSPALKKKPSVPILSVLNIKGLGPIWGEDIVGNCMLEIYSSGNFLIYSIIGIDVLFFQKKQLSTADDLAWNWVLVLRDPTPETYSNISHCLTRHSFFIEEISVMGDPVEGNNLKISQSCGGRNWEWGGPSLPTCVCVGGYEALMTVDWKIQCFPCLNGSVRARRTAGGCVPCYGPNEHAPYLGMRECVCKPGFKRSSTTGLCINAMESAPAWYYDLHSPTTVICLAVVLSFVAVALPTFIAYLFG